MHATIPPSVHPFGRTTTFSVLPGEWPASAIFSRRRNSSVKRSASLSSLRRDSSSSAARGRFGLLSRSDEVGVLTPPEPPERDGEPLGLRGKLVGVVRGSLLRSSGERAAGAAAPGDAEAVRLVHRHGERSADGANSTCFAAGAPVTAWSTSCLAGGAGAFGLRRATSEACMLCTWLRSSAARSRFTSDTRSARRTCPT